MYQEIGRNESERQVLKAVHISDIHLDPNYLIGASANCPDTTQGCCRAESTPPKKGDMLAARKFGEYFCDVPSSTLDLVLDHIVSL